VDDSSLMGVAKGLAHLGGYLEGLVYRQPVVRRLLEQVFDRASFHELAHYVGLPGLIPQVMDSNDVGVIAQAAHGLGFTADTSEAGRAEALSLDESKGYVPVEAGVVGQVDALPAALTEETLDLVAAGDKGRGDGRGGYWCG
jgi:hypothetical protein